MSTFDIVMIAVTIAFFALIPLVLRWSNKKRDQAAAELRGLLGDENILLLDPAAIFDGVASEGMVQTRGNGCLALTEEDVVFLWWLSREKIHIPRQDIRGAERVPSRRNGATDQELLEIRFRRPSGEDDTVSFYVTNIEAWLDALERLIQDENAVTRGLEAGDERGELPTNVPAEDGALW